MPEIIETVVYMLSELSEGAKDSAREWYRRHCLNRDWYEYVYEDFETVCAILGIRLHTSPVPLAGGGHRDDPHVFFRGFWNQGDGACFEGAYSYKRGSAKAIRVHAPEDTELHRIADALQTLQHRNFWQLNATIRQRGPYTHEYTMTISVERDSSTWQPITDDAGDTVTEALRDLARWLHRQLEREYAYQSSEEVVDETIAINEWTFTADGERFG